MIDAHMHCWMLGRNGHTWPTEAEAPIFRDWPLADLAAEAAPQGVQRAVLVQSQENAQDTGWLLDVTRDEPFVAAVVGWADLAAPDAAAHVAALAAHPKLKGLRPMVQDREADWYDDPALEAGLAAMVEHGLSLDALVRVRHLASLDRLARRMPDLPIVIDHAAKPRIPEARGLDEWRTAIAPLAERPNVFCKLSGLLTECGETPAEAVEPYIAAILELFGPERVLWGSDWPVLRLAGSYAEWFEQARAAVPAAARSDVFERTAARFYRLETSQ